MRATVALCNEKGEIRVDGSVGQAQLLPAASALAVAHAFGIPLSSALAALSTYEPPPGRGRLLAGLHESLVIDDSYNASPAAVEQALETLKVFPHAARRVAVLGDMLELGRYSIQEHERIGKVADGSVDLIVAVGIRSRVFATLAKKARVLTYDNSRDAAEALPSLIEPGDVILVKGSQSIRTERIVEALLADPSDTSRLVRQERAWKKRG